MQLDISVAPKVKTIICHYMKKVLLKKNKKYEGLNQNSLYLPIPTTIIFLNINQF